jgi:hypothetical protein
LKGKVETCVGEGCMGGEQLVHVRGELLMPQRELTGRVLEITRGHAMGRCRWDRRKGRYEAFGSKFFTDIT